MRNDDTSFPAIFDVQQTGSIVSRSYQQVPVIFAENNGLNSIELVFGNQFPGNGASCFKRAVKVGKCKIFSGMAEY
jgi:hypothetical protein